MKATVEIEVPTEFVEKRLAEIHADMRADGETAAEISEEQFFGDIIGSEVAGLGVLLWGGEADVRTEVVRVER